MPHYWLTLAMSKRLGADLATAWDDGTLDAETWACTVTECRKCSRPGACRKWLARPQHDMTPPAYCRNAAFLLDLATRQPGGTVAA
ncbi:hypothetical protein ROA7023_03610 [Roseisalinus antarcticus]|uniref:DUF6455 domain-containing protein n=2 Tax=Roseisalinus antarcticus TaxID=254357 RepID=A0A1Y5TTU5_9RHOB|nr:hypothetical protein ROA7023_03610 [Roseisalinus antarcticus]